MADWDPTECTITWGGVLIDSGFAPGTFISGGYAEDRVLVQAGADGTIARAINASKLGAITITLQNTSSKNTELTAVLRAARVGGVKSPKAAFAIVDRKGTTLVAGSEVWVQKEPDITRGKEISETAWTFQGRFEEIAAGGN